MFALYRVDPDLNRKSQKLSSVETELKDRHQKIGSDHRCWAAKLEWDGQGK